MNAQDHMLDRLSDLYSQFTSLPIICSAVSGLTSGNLSLSNLFSHPSVGLLISIRYSGKARWNGGDTPVAKKYGTRLLR
jgi:hypothetical protein